LIEQETSRKRSEENYKFIFKRTLKALKDKIKKNSERKLRKKEIEEFFLTNYFEEVSKVKNIPLTHF
jgi:hypothetical protein